MNRHGLPPHLDPTKHGKKWVMRYSIEGEAEIMADTREEAQEMFEAMSKEELAEVGELITDDRPKTRDEIRLEIAEIR